MTSAPSYCGLAGAFWPAAGLAATNHTGNGSRIRRPSQKNRLSFDRFFRCGTFMIPSREVGAKTAYDAPGGKKTFLPITD
jgi:hypothetical protein